ncbi:Essential recombination function protein [uncultured Caudovirales phage]|uniref:Essential recombination function protein n=1 Tax=uncultured Caudovirales phage TaxID=2100421 RepID=A0A6J7WQ23_9CAUD|nr:Essential recombination function protein [uncultured Caudovirales phage]
MRMSDEISQLATALAIAQGQIEDAVKDTKNDFYKSKYADLSSVRAAVRQPFADNGLSVAQFPRTVTGGIEVETVLLHKSGEFMSEVLFMPTKHEPHPIGSGISYARRYALMSVANLAADDDDGNAAQAAKLAAKTAPAPVEPDPAEIRRVAIAAKSAAEQGLDALNAFWRSLNTDERKLLTPEALKDLKTLAIASEKKDAE